MKRVAALARIVRPDRSPAAGLAVRLELFGLAASAWQTLAEGATDAEGHLRLHAELVLADRSPAPNLRLMRVAGDAVLSDGGPLRYLKSRALLSIDFGEIIDLGEDAVMPSALEAGTVKAVKPVAGISVAAATAVMTAAPAPAATAVDPQATALKSQLDASTRRVGELEKSLADATRANQQLSTQAQRVTALEKQVADATKANQQLTQDAARVGELEKNLADTTRDNQVRVAALEKQVADATRANQQLTRDAARAGQLEKSLADTTRDNQARVAALEKQVADSAKANQQLTRDAARVGELEKNLADTTRDNQVRVAELEKQVADTSRINEQLTRDAARVGELEKNLADTTRDSQVRIAALEKQVADAGRINEQLTRDAGRVAELEKGLADSTRENAQLIAETQRIAELESRLAAAEQANAALSAPTEKKVAMTAMATNLGEQLGTAQLRIREQPGSLALSGVKVRLKGIVEDGATAVTFPNAEDLAKPDFAKGLADIEMDFASAPPPPVADTVEVPDVRRLTEGAVRQLLNARGLRLEVVNGPAGSGGVAAGQAALQAPGAGMRAARGAVVTVIFAG